MKLHYSQTRFGRHRACEVLLPYEITLFSNQWSIDVKQNDVLLPYEITLFSNAYEVVDTVPNGFTTL